MRAAFESGGLEERYCIKQGLAGTLRLKGYLTYCRAQADATKSRFC